nr:MAG TPA: hypothetical protein [Caudoviricetes sp.]
MKSNLYKSEQVQAGESDTFTPYLPRKRISILSTRSCPSPRARNRPVRSDYPGCLPLNPSFWEQAGAPRECAMSYA